MKASRTREPSRASLREMPEIDFSNARRNPYAADVAARGITIQVGRARPKLLVPPQVSLNLPKAVWKRVEARASARGISIESALREAILEWATEAA